MIVPPEFDPDFYRQQNLYFVKIYGEQFRKWKLTWVPYYNKVRQRLRQNEYWIWVFLCGLKPFINEQDPKDRESLVKRLAEDARLRCWKITHPSDVIDEYIREL